MLHMFTSEERQDQISLMKFYCSHRMYLYQLPLISAIFLDAAESLQRITASSALLVSRKLQLYDRSCASLRRTLKCVTFSCRLLPDSGLWIRRTNYHTFRSLV